MTAVGYIRQSRRADLDVALSPEQQRHDIETLAARDGVTVDTVYEDLGRSGAKGKERQRRAYQELVAALEDGGVATLYTKTLTRLGRSVTELYRIVRIAEATGCRIVTLREGTLDPSTAIGKAQFGMMAVFAEFERDLAVERARDNVATRRANGETMGRRPYGEAPGQDPAVVVDAFRRAGSYRGAAEILNAAGIRSHLGRLWRPPSVRLVVARHAPQLMPRNPRRGAKAIGGGFRLYGLLRCAKPCGAILTAAHDRRRPGAVVYRCHGADGNPQHPHPLSVAESVLMPWIMAEAARLRVPQRQYEDVVADQARRGELETERDRLAVLFSKSKITEDVFDRLAAPVDVALEALADAAVVVRVVPERVPWNAPVAELSTVLRALWERVELDADMRPVRAEWTVPEWRQA